MLAGYFSKAGNSGQIPVDYTLIKNVHKPSGAKPGFVTYDNQKLCMLHLIMNIFKNETIIIKLSTNKHLTIRKDYFFCEVFIFNLMRSLKRSIVFLNNVSSFNLQIIFVILKMSETKMLMCT